MCTASPRPSAATGRAHSLHDKQHSERNQFLNARGQFRTAIRVYIISDEKAVGCLPRTAEVSSQAGRFPSTLPSSSESPFGRSSTEPHRNAACHAQCTQQTSQPFAPRAGPLYAKILRLNPGKDAHKAGSDQRRLRTPEPHGPPTRGKPRGTARRVEPPRARAVPSPAPTGPEPPPRASRASESRRRARRGPAAGSEAGRGGHHACAARSSASRATAEAPR